MSVLLGFVMVAAAVSCGYVLAKGEFALLYQPAEFVIIWGAAVGSLVMATPPRVLWRIVGDVGGVFARSPYGLNRYLETLRLFYLLFQEARKKGMMGLERDIEKPQDSKLFQMHPEMLKDRRALLFFCDTFRMAIAGGALPTTSIR